MVVSGRGRIRGPSASGTVESHLMKPRISPANRGLCATGIHQVARSSSLAPRRALTLVEMLIGLAITLVMMAAVVNLFANLSAGVKIRRATMEMSGELRMMRAVLFNDLAGATCRALPWQRPDEDPGYIEIVEGNWEDSFPTGETLDLRTSQVPGSQLPPANAGEITDARGLGDYDDILALTVRSENTPFKGRLTIWDNTAGQWTETSIESNLAEIIWYAVENPANGSLGEPGMRTVYRRVLPIAPWIPSSSQPLTMIPPYTDQIVVDTTKNPPVTVTVRGIPEDDELYRYCDVSFHRQGDLRVPNTLGDLTKRENRFAHHINGVTVFPHRIDQTAIRVAPGNSFPTGSTSPLHPFGEPFSAPSNDRQGEDVMLSNVLAFDVRVFDPGAPLFDYQGTIVEPTADNIFSPAIQAALSGPPAGALVGFGAYVDLGWDNDSGGVQNNIPDYDYTDARFSFANPPQPLFQQAHRLGWHPRNPTAFRGNPAVYDTWSYHYEHDGLDQDNDGSFDEGANGLDDDGANGVDDVLERETSPPYPVPLRGMQVILRIYEPDTRQIREATVTRSFVPQ